MNIPRVRNTLEKHFGKTVQILREGVLKTPYTTNGTVIGWFFFDLNQQIFNDRFDLKSYQDILLSEDYYHATGSQQWNFYLFFICDPNNYKDPDNAPLLRRIEKDKAFARKYVTTEELLDSELPGAVQVSTSAERPTDISLRWEEKLRDARLDGVLMKSVPRTKVVESYLSGQPVRERQKSEARKAKGRRQFSSIKQLRITEGYRKYPEQKNFVFGPCNLIEGSNGSGKTSLLEAIELWTCGANFRDQLQSEDGRIGLSFEDGKGLEWNTTRGTQLYRERDWQWYGNHYAKGNKLCFGFNRFNFYNTDAAVRLEETGRGEEKTVLNALSDLVLGETATMIEERAQSIFAIFTQEQKGFQKLIALYTSEVEAAQGELKALGPTRDKEADVLRKFIAQIKRLGWIGELPASTEKSIDKFAERFAEVRDRFQRSQRALWWLTTFDLATLESEENLVANLLDKAEKANKRISEHKVSINSLQNDIETIEHQTNVMRAYLPYITNPDSAQLADLKESIAAKQQMLQLYRRAQKELRFIDLQRHIKTQQPIATALSELQTLIWSRSRRVEELTESVRSVKKHTELSTQLFATIRTTASELLASLPDLTHCPVCGEEYHPGQLKSLLLEAEAASTSDGDTGAFRHLLEEQKRAEADLGLLTKEFETYRRINNAYNMLHKSNARTSVGSIVKRLFQLSTEADRASARYEELTALETRLHSKGLDETQYQRLRTDLQHVVTVDLLEPSAAVKFGRRLKEKENSLRALNDRIRKLESAIGAIETRRTVALHKYFIAALTSSPEEELRRRQQTLISIVRSFALDGKNLKRGESLDITDINLLMDRIQTAYEEFLKARKYLQESEHVRTRNAAKIKQAEKELAKLTIRTERARDAIATLTDILENDSKEKHLSSFLRKNTCEIADTFRLIHSPREFTDIEFDVEHGQILLTKAGSNKLSVTKISSGQRAALALSVFLTLNRKVQNGPPFMIFDDPVAHIDDLNVLSFFDYLRETMLKLKRQIFFATANEKVSYLFKKKFDFLGDGFKVHTLSRTDARG